MVSLWDWSRRWTVLDDKDEVDSIQSKPTPDRAQPRISNP